MLSTERIALDREKFSCPVLKYGNSDPVLFYRPIDSWGGFSNFSNHAVELPNPWTGEKIRYPTGEHRYQAMKATSEDEHDYVLGAQEMADGCRISARETKRRGRTIALRSDWGNSAYDLCYYVMFETVLAKVKQNDGPRNILYRTRGRLIYEDSPTDDIWGWRSRDGEYDGKNLLGIVLMRARDYL